jgi:hypothetical protein
MRYKNNVLDKLVKADGILMRINLQVSRGMSQDETLKTIEDLKEQLGSIREMIEVEPDDFEQQFSPNR